MSDDFHARAARLRKMLGQPEPEPVREPAPIAPPSEGESILDVVAKQFPYGQHVSNGSFHQKAIRRIAEKKQERRESRSVGLSGGNGVGKGG